LSETGTQRWFLRTHRTIFHPIHHVNRVCFLHLTVIDLEVPVADGHTPKVDSSAKFVGLVGAVLLLAAVYYLVTSLIHVITGQTFKNEFAPSATTTEAAAPAAAPAETAAPAAAAPAAAAASGGDAAAGKTKYATCAACHGADGKGNGGAFPDLTKLSAADAEGILHAFKKGDKDFLAKHGLGGARYGTMAPQAAGLSDADIADLGADIAELGGHSASAAPAAGAAPAAAPAAAAAPTQKIVSSEVVAWGHALFSSCAVCHGAAGEGGKLFGAPKLAGLPYNSVVSLLNLYRKGQQMGTNSYAMIPQAKHLTDSEIDALASYIAVMNSAADKGATATE
jgi:cytochrome c553